MANYFVINNKFKPYSFDELIKPYQMYADEYRRQEAALDAAREKEFSSTYLNPDLDKEAYTMYNQATGDLQSVSDELSSKGLSAGLRSRIRSTARDYKNTMDALNTAQARLYAEQERRAKLGPDYVYQQGDIRIGDFLNGNTPNQRGESLSGITKDIATDFATRARSITNSTWDKVLAKNGRVVGGYYDVTTETGLSAAQLDTILSDENTWNSIMRDTNISKSEKEELQRFRNVISSKKAAIGYNDYGPGSQAQIDDAIARGASAGLQTVTHQYQQDKGYDPLGWSRLRFEERKYNDAIAAEEAAWEHEPGKPISPATRTTLKEGYEIKDGKVTTKSSNKSTATTEYGTTTPTLTLHINGKTNTYKDWADATKSNEGKASGVKRGLFGSKPAGSISEGFNTIAVEDLIDEKYLDLKKELLARNNISTSGKGNSEIDDLILEYAPALSGLHTIQIRENEDGTLDWAISDKNVQRQVSGMGNGEQVDINSKDIG